LKNKSLLDWLNRSGWTSSYWGSELNSGLVTCKKPSLLMGSIEWVDEGVDSGAVGTGRNTVHKVVHVVWSKVGSVPVELEVTVGRVVGVDEWVEVGIDGFVNIVVVNGLSDRNRGSFDNNRSSSNLNWSGGFRSFSSESS